MARKKSEHPVLDQLIEYANLCLNDAKIDEFEDYISCQKHKWACQRFLNDIKRSEARNTSTDYFPYVWDDAAAQNIIDWFAELRHSKGVLAGKPIILTPSQRFDLCQLYGWKHEKTGYKRFKKSFKEVARKNAKSQEEAGAALYEISTQSTKNHEVYEYYTAGTKREQSKIVFEEAKLMLKGSRLQEFFKCTRDIIEHRKTKSFIKALNKQDGKEGDGTNPAGLILDEYHQHKTTEFYDLFLGANTKEPLLMIITTAGMDLTYPCYTQEYDYCSKILDPNVDVTNDTYFVDIYELDPEDYENPETLENERLWHKANPIRMSYENGQTKIREEYEIAKNIPDKLTAFLTKCLNIWVQAKAGHYMDMAKWKNCERKELPIDITGMSVYVGFDMSAKIDLTSVSFVIPFKTGKKRVVLKRINDESTVEEERDVIGYIVFTHSFIPNRAKLAERMATDKVPYDSWEREGYLTVTDSQVIDQNVVLNYVLEFCRKFKLHIETLCFDPSNSTKLMLECSENGFDVEEVYQSHKQLNECTVGFRDCVYEGDVYYLRNPLFNYAMSNAVIAKSNGLIKIDKDATTKRIDPVDSTLAAFKLAMFHKFESSINLNIEQFISNVDF